KAVAVPALAPPAVPAVHVPTAPAAARPPLADRILAWRDGLLASPRFQRWAASFPLTRPVALRRSRRLFDLCAGFVYSQALLACHRLGLLDALAEGPCTPAALAERLGLEADALDRLLGAALALELAERRPGGRIGLGPLGAPLVGNGAVAAMLEHNALLYDDLRDPVALLRGRADTRLARFWPYAAETGGSAAAPAAGETGGAAAYSALMAASQPLVAAEVLDAYDVSRHRRLLDVGGGEGAFLKAAAARAPELRLALFELPAVADRARDTLRAVGLAARAEVHAGDFRRDPLPGGADLATLVRVLHDHPDDVVLAVLRAVHRALEPGGTLLVAEPMAGVRGAETVGAAYFAFYLLAMGSGRARTPDEYRGLLLAAGFREARVGRPRLPVQTALVVARK
ncbi:MAG TPA: methyltransferase, partial [Longimicrobiaceae bacterium]|nr:methyltransferase [Longimicrobiaceae bacterium]